MFFKILSLNIVLIGYLYSNTCTNPIVASDDLNKKFRYGCFCGEGYPKIQDESTSDYKKLNKSQREKIIAKYSHIEAYDDIDKACKEHDICFIKHGKKAKVCNDKIVTELTKIRKEFNRYEDDNLTNKQCSNLAFDISSVFNTIFSPSDDEDSIFDFGMLMFNGVITATNRIGQEAMDTVSNHPPRYPSKGVKCNIKEKKRD